MPIPVKEQPDPFLQMSTGKSGIGGIVLFAVAAVVILCVVLYGLNAPVDVAATAPPPNATAQPSAPAAGGHGGPAAPTAPQTTNNAKG